MSFANPKSDAVANASSYVASLLAVLGDRDPMRVLAELPDAVAALVAGMTDEELRTPERAGKWSVMQVLQHLADTEIVYGYRWRVSVAEEAPPLVGYDQDLWATRLHYHEGPPAELLEEIRVMRRRNLRLLRALSDEELDRVGMHSERGPESVRRGRELVAAHDLVHRAQIARIRAIVAAAGAAATGTPPRAGGAS